MNPGRVDTSGSPSFCHQHLHNIQKVLNVCLLLNGRQVWWWDTLFQESRDQWVLILSAQGGP